MSSKVINRYALALFKEAEKSNMLEKIAEDSNNIIGLIKSSKELYLFFASPVIKQDKKIKIVESLFKNKVSELCFDFIKFLIIQNRENLISEILKTYLDLKNDSEGKAKAIVKTAVQFDESDKKKMKKKIDEFTGKNSIPEFVEDKSLLGGFTIQVDDTVIDASIKRQLDNLKDKFRDINIKSF